MLMGIVPALFRQETEEVMSGMVIFDTTLSEIMQSARLGSDVTESKWRL